ncbi:MAG TPA: carboxylesterase family protein, partial [Novosphingobium sp.]|nr:carboxylesterase family protein [Novosphingobium sp.]
MAMKTFALLAVTALLSLAPSSALADDAGPVVKTAYGSVIGLSRGGAEAFEGIPYAAAPIGNLRWSPPQRPHGWATPLDARHPGSACPQPPPAGGIAGSIPGVEENCLFLNVWRPQVSGVAPHPPLPVMVWFHGGGMRSSAGHVYEAARLVTRGKPMIVV